MNTNLVDWQRACYIHLIPVPKNNCTLTHIFETLSYEEFAQNSFNSNITDDVEATNVLTRLYQAITVSDQKALNLWGTYLDINKLSKYMRKLCIRYSPYETIDKDMVKYLTIEEKTIIDEVQKKEMEIHRNKIQKNRLQKIKEIEDEIAQLQKKLMNLINPGIIEPRPDNLEC